MADERKIGTVEIDHLFDFLDGLQASGYKIDPRQFSALSDLLMALVAHGESLDELPLKTIIAPLICSTPFEQQDFYQQFDRWYTKLLAGRPVSFEEEMPLSPQESTSKLRFKLPTISYTSLLWTLGVGIVFVLFAWLVFNFGGTITALANPNLTFYGVIIAMFTVSVWIGRRLWILVEENQYITSTFAKQEPVYVKLPVKGYVQEILPEMQFKPIVSAFRKRMMIPSLEIDLGKTLENVIDLNNWKEIVYRQRQVMPEYVVLIDRMSHPDQQARLVQEVLTKIAADGVWLHQYEFSGDPRICFPLNRKSTPLRLTNLQSRHPDSRLLVFIGASNLVDPLTGFLPSWIKSLSNWRERAILTLDNLQKTQIEDLHTSGFAILPTSIDGLASIARAFERDHAPLPIIKVPALPARLTERSLNVRERYMPHETEVTTLINDLKIYLGENGFYWLCATAVYPELRWELTLYIGNALKDDLGKPLLNLDILLRLARLPWFRFGYMSDWVRLAFINSLTAQQESFIREAFSSLLSTAYTGEEFDIGPINQGNSPTNRARNFLNVLFRNMPSNKSLQDYILVKFISKSRNKETNS